MKMQVSKTEIKTWRLSLTLDQLEELLIEYFKDQLDGTAPGGEKHKPTIRWNKVPDYVEIELRWEWTDQPAFVPREDTNGIQ